MGSHVWAEDPDTCWVDGEVVKINGEEAEIQATNGKKVITHAFGFCQLSGKLILGFEFYVTLLHHTVMLPCMFLDCCEFVETISQRYGSSCRWS